MTRVARMIVFASVFSLLLVAVQGGPAEARSRKRHRKPPTPRTLDIADTASLSPDGQTADVILYVDCPGYTPASIKVTLQQNSVSGVGHSGADYKCNGQRQRLDVPVTAASGTFRTGPASVNASVLLHTTEGNGVKNPSVARYINLV
jgi:hypothetical protein